MASFNTTATMRRILRIPAGDESYTDTELQEFLDEAQADMFSEIKRQKEIDTFCVDWNKWGAVQTEHKFLLAPVTSVFEVYANGVLVSNTDYTLNADRDVLIFLNDILNLGETIEIYYIPDMYTTTERYLCAYNIKITENLLNQDGNSVNLSANYEKKYKRNIQILKNKIRMATYT